jgi:hypothetical protein
MEEPKPGEIYLHFKNKKYEIIAIALDCEIRTKKIVVYKQLYESENPAGTIWVRSLEDFVGEKEFGEDTEINGRVFRKGERVKRFVLLS